MAASVPLWWISQGLGEGKVNGVNRGIGWKADKNGICFPVGLKLTSTNTQQLLHFTPVECINRTV